MLIEMNLNEQLNWFKTGFPDVKLIKAATPETGIRQLTPEEEGGFIKRYEQAGESVEKFIPASGAATRMFRDLLEYRVSGKPSEKVKALINRVGELPFGIEGSEQEILTEMFDIRAYHNLPKGLLPFHTINGRTVTPAEEHLIEALGYANKSNPIRIHFTVSPQHKKDFQDLLEAVVVRYKEKFDITYSVQNPETNTVAVNLENEPVKLENGEYLLRPAGHGALLENLDARTADLIFIKNIDNVVPDRLKAETIKYKKILAGVLLDVQSKLFELLEAADAGSLDINQAKKFLEKCGVKEVNDEEVFQKLNRPIRVCGMVKNSGEPGGGPFWVEFKGSTSLQIVEGAQIDKTNKAQLEILNESTHFNPVDIVCGVKDYKGRKFDLMKFTDPTTGFIAQKTFNGQPIKALELPGLWNGGMADWNTIFVEVPLITFNPVKTVNDLLRPEHQP